MTTLAWPTRTHENWRRAPFLSPPEGLAEVQAPAGGEWAIAPALAAHVSLDNGEASVGELPAGVSMEALGAEESWEFVAPPGGEAWLTWARGLAGGHLLALAPGAEAEVVVRQRIATGGGAAGHALQVAVGEGASLSLTLLQEGPEASGGLHAGGLRVVAGAGAKAKVAVAQDIPHDTDAYMVWETRAGAGAAVAAEVAVVGGRRSRTEIRLAMDGERSTNRLRGLFLAGTGQRMDFQTHQDHIVGESESDLLLKGGVSGKGRAVYQGMINISPGAQKSNAYQTNRNILLGKSARMDTIPGLEIEANDVACSHGATVSRLSPESLFYLSSRGIPRGEAARLLAEGFFYEVADGLPEQVRQWARGRARRELAAALAGATKG